MRGKKWVLAAVVLLLIIAIPVGWKMYENKKEADRRALIHMGDDLNKAWSDFEKDTAVITKNGNMAKEYTEIMMGIVDGKIKAEDVKDKVCEMEKELMKIYPDIYKEPSSVCK